MDVADVKSGKVDLSGWVQDKRILGKVAFFVLRDQSGKIQITTKDERMIKTINSLPKESAVIVEGRVKKSKKAPGGIEIIPSKIELVSTSEVVPLTTRYVKAELDTRLNWRCLDLRNEKRQAVFKIEAKIVEGLVDYFLKNKFFWMQTPCLMASPSEGGADMFPVIYFNKEAFMRQDPMLHRQLVIASGFKRVFEMGPSWRAEKSHTTRHVCEHRTVAAEIAFIENEYDVIKVEQAAVLNALKLVKKDCKNELTLLGKKIEIPKKDFPILEFPAVYEILKKHGKKIPYGEDYDTQSEKILGLYVKKRYDADFFFVNKFPYKAKPFYVMRDKRPWARSVDLLCKGLELSSGGQRENRYEVLVKQAKEKKMNLKNLEWYLKFFKYGVPPHGGFSLGFERMTQALLDLDNIQEAILFPRTPERLEP